MQCKWNSCQQHAYGDDEYCYYHKKVIKGFLHLEDRNIYLNSEIEKEYAKKTDEKNYDIKQQSKVLNNPVVVEIIKLSLYMLCKKTKLPRKYFISDVNLLALFDLTIPDIIYDRKKFIQYNAIRFIGIIYRQYKKELSCKRFEISLNNNNVSQIDSESEIIKEQEEHLKQRAFYISKKQMTKIERKVFVLLEKREQETTIANKLHISKPRVSKLKQRAFKRVRELMKLYG
jgi:hypothetical protein